MQALRMDKNGGVCSRTNPWPERCFGTEFILDTWNRESVRFAFGTRPPTSGRKRALISCARQIRVCPELGRKPFLVQRIPVTFSWRRCSIREAVICYTWIHRVGG